MSGERRPRRYRATQVTEYSSERKRMSVVAEPEREAEGGEDEDGDVLLICKGADAAVAPLLRAGARTRKAVDVVDVVDVVDAKGSVWLT